MRSANGTPQVNIQTPGADGVSHNSYRQFDVDKQGVILNNSANTTQTQLGGMVAGNPWLAKGEAKIILNEVNSRDPSHLNGWIEVAGRKAEVVIANPAGITCNGCGFINAHRTTLTTGEALMEQGRLKGFDVNQGEVRIDGHGMDSTQQSYTDIIARSVAINAKLHAQDLKVTTGRNIVDAAHQQIEKKSADNKKSPEFALDVAALGGMYAHKIRLIGTEAGVGVHNAGNIGATAGEVHITADGWIGNNGTLSSRDALQLTASSNISNTGKLLSQSTVNLHAKGTLNNQGRVEARGDTTVTADTIHSSHNSVWAAGLDDNGNTTRPGSLTLTAQYVQAGGKNLATDTLAIQSRQIDLSGSQTAASQIQLTASQSGISTAHAIVNANRFTAQTPGQFNNDKGQLVAREIHLTTPDISNQLGKINQTGPGELTLNTRTLNNGGGTLFSRGKQLTITTDTLNNQQGNIASQGDNLSLTAQAVNNTQGQVQLAGNGKLSLNTQRWLGDKGKLLTNGALTIQAGDLQLNEAETQAGQMTINADTLSHQHGVMQQQGKDTLSLTTRRLDNQNGTIAGNGNLNLKATTVDNRHGHIVAAEKGTLALTIKDTLDNQSGQLEAGNALQLRAAQLDNSQGSIVATGDSTTLTVGKAIQNAHGYLEAKTRLITTSQTLNNTQGVLLAQNINSQTHGHPFINNAGQVIAEDTLTVNSGQLDNTAGLLQSGHEMDIDTHDHWLANTRNADQKAGRLLSGGQLTLRTGDVDNTGGIIVADGKTVLISAALNNTQGQIAGNGGLDIHSRQLTNHNGTLQSADTLDLDTNGQLLDNQQGRILSEGTTTVTSGQLDNTAGLLQAGREMSIDTHGHWLTNTRNADQKAGQLLSGGHLTLRTGDIDNTGGRVAGNGGLDIHSRQLINHEGTLQSADALTLDTDGQLLDNQQGRILSEGATTVTSGQLDNRQGHLQGGQLAIDTRQAQTDNRDGKLLSADRLNLKTQRLDNRHGQVQAVGDTTINVQEKTDNTDGLIRGGQQLTLNTAHLINHETAQPDNGVEAQNLTINAQQADNTGGALRAAHHLQANISQTLNNIQGLVSAGKQLTVKSEAQQPHLVIHNRQGTLIAGKQADISAGALSGDGQLLSQGDMAVTLTEDFHHTGNTAANGNLTLKTTGNILNDRQIKAGQALHLDAQNLTNSASGEISAGQTQINVHDTLNNTGLIDGDLTHLTANTLNNTGTGRIYGDQLALQTGTLNNTAQDGKAAVIAARDRLDIGTGTLNNQHHAQIYSVGDMRIGGQLDKTLTAIRQARELNNHAATMEAGRNLTIQADQIHNTNAGLVTQVVETEKSPHHDAVLSGQTARYDWSQVDTSHRNKYGVHDAIMPDGSRSNNFYEYQYTRTVKETQVKQSDPGKILAGGNMTLNSAQVTNHDSQIVAGGALGGEIGKLHNIATQGERITTDKGRQTHWYAKKTKRWHRLGTKTSQGKSRSNYDPAPVTETIDLKALAWQDHTQPEAAGIPIADRQTGQVQQAPTAVKPVAGINTPPLVLPPDPPLVLPPGQPLVLPPGQPFELTLPPEIVKGQTVDPVIRVITPDTRLPDNSLYTVQPGSDSHYLVETDPKFTQYKQWLGSDYMQQQLTHDPALVHKRLGDGFYEQRLVREQITQLTGQRYLSGYNNDEAQFKALMDAGITFGKQQQLTPGVALSPAQMALLTSDIIWLTNQTVTLPDGSTEVVTVPQVYARVRQGDLSSDGALLAGNTVALNSQGDITNSGTVSGRDVTQLTANNLTNHGFIRGGKVDLTAQQTLTNRGGQIQGNDRVTLKGRDITSVSTVRGDEANRWLDRPAGIYVRNDKGTLSLSAINNVQLTASEVKNAGKDGHTEITAGHDLTLETLNTQHTESGDWGGGNTRHLTQQQDIGSQITGAGDVTLQAGHDLKATAAHVNAGQQLTARAGNDLMLTTGTASSDLVEHSKQTSKGWLSKSSVETHDEVHDRQALSTTFSGDKVNLQAGNDLHISGSNVAGTQDVSLNAGHQLTVTTAAETHQETHLRQEKKSGLMGTGGIGFTVGKASQKTITDRDSQLTKGSTVGSSQGNVTLNAGEQLQVHGSDVVAGKDLTLTGQQVTVTSAENHHTTLTKTEQKHSGLTVALSGAAGGALNTAVQTAREAQQSEDSRVKALQNTKAALSGVQATQAARLAAAQGSDNSSNNNLAGVSLSYGRQSSRSEQQHRQTTQQGSHLTAGDNLTITANGNGSHNSDRNGDIRIQGSQLQAGKDLQLNASRDIQLASSQNTEQTTGKNSSHGSSLGVGLTAGPGGTGLNVSASVNQGKGRESGNGVSHNNTTLQAGQTVTLNSGRDATLKGAQVSGEQITAEVKRHLTLSSEQDSNRYDSQQQNTSAGASVTVGPQPGGTLSLSASRDKLHSNFDSVKEQTGLYAGKGGYQVNVGEHTQLDGAVIASTADKANNTLDTGTLGFKTIHNQADFKTEHQSAGLSTGGPVGSQLLNNLAANTLVGANRAGHAESTTQAAVSDGTVIIRDKAAQQQDIRTLSRDTDNAGNALNPIFDKEKEQQRLKQAQLIGEIGAQARDIASTEGAIIATKAAKAKIANIHESDKAAAKEKRVKAGNRHPTEDDIKKQLYDTAYTQALNESGFGTGGKYQKALQATTAALQGLAGGDLKQGLAGGASPYLAGVIKDLTTDPQTHQVDIATNTLAHAILGAVAAEASGGSALAGAAGAASGELAAQVLIKQLYGDKVKVSELSEEQKQTISTLSTLAAGLAGGIAGDSTGSVITGAQTGKNAIENNYLSVNELDNFAHQARTCEGESCKQVIKDMVETNIRNQQEMMDFCNSNPNQCAQKYGYLVNQWPVFERTLKNMDRDGTLPVEFRNYLSAVNTLGQAATGKVGELGWTKRFEAMGMSKETAAAMAMTLPVIVEGSKGPKSSPTTKGSTGAVVNTEKAALEKIGQNSQGTTNLGDKSANTVYHQQLIKNAEKISTAKPGQQVAAPRDLNEQTFWKQVKSNPLQGSKLLGMNKDPRFPTAAGFQKMEAKHRLPNGQTITIHYQYNSNTGKAYDMKITTPQRIQQDPKKVIDSIKDNVK
nr:hemagglutinin repeat-containing protein [Photorhabdus khanii]